MGRVIVNVTHECAFSTEGVDTYVVRQCLITHSYLTLPPTLSRSGLSHKPRASSKAHGLDAWLIVKVKVTSEESEYKKRNFTTIAKYPR